MNYDRILIRYGEMSLKGRNRKHFINKVEKKHQVYFRDFEKIQIQSDWDRMYVLLNGELVEPIIARLKNVFGIQSFSPAIKTDKDIDAIRVQRLHIMEQAHSPGNTFKVSARRSDKTFEYDTNGLNHAVGAHILLTLNDIKVDVKKPDINLIVEIRHDAAYISGEVIREQVDSQRVHQENLC